MRHADRIVPKLPIEVIDAERSTSCDICVNVCSTNLFDETASVPVIVRQNDCQTSFLCELYCPEDALFEPVAAQSGVRVFADGVENHKLFRCPQTNMLLDGEAIIA